MILNLWKKNEKTVVEIDKKLKSKMIFDDEFF
jgi:hypothetical protein